MDPRMKRILFVDDEPESLRRLSALFLSGGQNGNWRELADQLCTYEAK